MLARMVSDTRNAPGTITEIFIDRNGDRFQQVLDYLRDPEMFIPDALICRELDYFGIPHTGIPLPKLPPRLYKSAIEAGEWVYEKHAASIISRKQPADATVSLSCRVTSSENVVPDGAKAVTICLARLSAEQLSDIWVQEYGIKCCSIKRENEDWINLEVAAVSSWNN